MNTILPVAGGKGGIGKTIFSANLGVALAQLGKTTVLIDLDLGSSNLHTCLGIKNRHPGIGSYIYKKADSLQSLIVETDVPSLFFIPGDSLFPGTANLPFFTKQKILKEIDSIPADFVILDLGAGSAYNTIDFYLSSSSGIIMSTPETTSILSAYSFLKNTVYRLLFRSFKAKSTERDIIKHFVSEPIEESSGSFNDLIPLLQEHSEESAEHARSQLASFYPRVVLNIGSSNKDFAIGGKLREIASKNIGIGMEYIGFLPAEANISRSILERTPYILLNPNSPFSSAIATVARKISASTHHRSPRLYTDDEDIRELQKEFIDGSNHGGS
ncbi:MAG: P-loop NTPase [Spirochaetia bacterium]